jgi:hypothetical protein
LNATVAHAHAAAVPVWAQVGEAGVLTEGAKVSATPNPSVADPGVADAVFSSEKLRGVPSESVFPDEIAANEMTLAFVAFV